MKTLKFITSIFLTLMIIACSSSDSSNSNTNPGTSEENSWSFDGNKFKADVNNQSRDFTSSNEPFTLIKNQQLLTMTNGYNSSFSFVFNTHQPGTYTVKSLNTVIGNRTSKFITFFETTLIKNSVGASYECSDTSITVKVEEVNGKFEVTADSDITLTKISGNASLPNTVVFKCNKLK